MQKHHKLLSTYVLKDVGYKTGFYVSHELYKKYDLDKVKADFLWLPRYGKDNGKPDKNPDYPCCLWQYSQYCKVDWYKGGLDFNLLNGDKSLEWFTGKKKTTPVNKPKKKTESKPVSKPKDEKYTVVKTLNAYINAADAKARKNVKGTVSAGTYHVFNKANGMINVTPIKGVAGSWINPADNKKSATSTTKAKYHVVGKGEVLSKIAAKYNTSVSAILKLNKNIKDKNLIYANQKIRVK
ncbi:LysM peptidoglycan-binding domain-containing protein [Heyndrickxia sporothermodurans]|uniref:LysM peptidoglycan-binding domain-containing protein n=1 Tax=Heyndrickxia sporothermodurans TaxID=46224 RepID=UPI001F2F4F94|nr:LysM peptidoglycan-binding domain-containing protein [Heyndrickxia sporothermodurans]